MARAFSDEERVRIELQLRGVALERFTRQGVRAVRIDDLCRDAGIAKGTFYAFFASKEELFMSLADAADERHKTEMLDYLSRARGQRAKVVRGFVDLLIAKIESDPVLAIVRDPGELQYLLAKLPPDRLADNERRDLEFLQSVSEVLVERRLAPHATVETLQGVMTMLLSLYLQQELLGRAAYQNAVSVLVEMSLQRLIRGRGDLRS